MSNGPAPIFTGPAYFLPFMTPLTASTTVVSVDPSSIPPGASGAIISNAPGGGAVHFGYGTNPSTAVGVPILAGEGVVIEDIQDMTQLRFIRQSTTDGLLTFHFIAMKNKR